MARYRPFEIVLSLRQKHGMKEGRLVLELTWLFDINYTELRNKSVFSDSY